jgi:hypothetical protein
MARLPPSQESHANPAGCSSAKLYPDRNTVQSGGSLDLDCPLQAFLESQVAEVRASSPPRSIHLKEDLLLVSASGPPILSPHVINYTAMGR